MPRTIADTVANGGVPQNGISVDGYKASRFGAAPAQGSSPPGGGPDAGPVVSGPAFGGPGEWRIVATTIEDYYCHAVVAGLDTWQFYPASSVAAGVNSLTAADGTIVVTGTASDPIVGVGAIPESKVSNLVTDLAAKVTNPMTTPGDLIVGAAAGAPARLALGANGQVLTITAGAVGWAAAASGFANPMTAVGDLIVGAAGGTAARRAVGTVAQVLRSDGTNPQWATLASADVSYSAGVVVPAAGAQRALVINAAVTSQGNIWFQDAGVDKWQIGKGTDDSFYVYDNAGSRYALQAFSNGDLQLMNNGVHVSAAGLITANAGLTATGTITLPAASIPESVVINLTGDLALKANLAGPQTHTGVHTFGGQVKITSGAPWFDITGMAGFVGDGVTSDQTAFSNAQRAIEAFANNTGGVIFVPPGTKLCGALTFNSLKPTLVIMWGSTLSTVNNSVALTINTEYGGQARGVQFDGLRINVPRTQSNCFGIQFKDSDRIVLNNWRVEGCFVGMSLKATIAGQLGSGGSNLANGGWVEECKCMDGMIFDCVEGIRFELGDKYPQGSFGENFFVNCGIVMRQDGLGGTPIGLNVTSFSRVLNDGTNSGTGNRVYVTATAATFIPADKGRLVTSSNLTIPANTHIASVDSATQVTLDQDVGNIIAGTANLTIWCSANLYRSTFLDFTVWANGAGGVGAGIAYKLDGAFESVRGHLTMESAATSGGTLVGVQIANAFTMQNLDLADITLVFTGIWGTQISNPGSKPFFYKKGSHKFYTNSFSTGAQWYLDPIATNVWPLAQVELTQAGGGGMRAGPGTSAPDTGWFRDAFGGFAVVNGINSQAAGTDLLGLGAQAYLIAKGFAINSALATIFAPINLITTTETKILSIPVPPGVMKVGTTYRIKASGLSTSTNPDLSHFRLRIGPTTLTGAIILDTTPTAVPGTAIPWAIEITVRINNIATGGAVASSVLWNNGVTGVSSAAVFVTQGAATANNVFDCTLGGGVTNLIELTYQSAAATTSASFRQTTIEIVQI